MDVFYIKLLKIKFTWNLHVIYCGVPFINKVVIQNSNYSLTNMYLELATLINTIIVLYLLTIQTNNIIEYNNFVVPAF